MSSGEGKSARGMVRDMRSARAQVCHPVNVLGGA